MANAKVIDIFDPLSGEVKKWTRFSARLGQYLAEYPIKEGWRTLLETSMAASKAPELLSLYQAALQAGINPREAGLPALPAGMIFTATLVSPDGKEMASGSSTLLGGSMFGQGAQPKEFECHETAVFQRLLAAVGMGGEVFDDDEDRNIASVGGSSRHSEPVSRKDSDKGGPGLSVVSGGRAAHIEVVVDEAGRGDPDGLPDVLSPEEALAEIVGRETRCATVTADPTTDSSTPVQKAEPAIAAVVAKTTPSGATRRKGMASNGQLLSGMKKMLEVLAKQANAEANEVSTLEEAEAEQARLVALLNPAR